MNKIFNHFLHGQVGYELINAQVLSGDGIESADAMQMLLDVAAIVGDAAGRDHRVVHDLEADFAAQIVGYFPLASAQVILVEQAIQLIESDLKFKLVIVQQLFLLAFACKFG